MNTSFDVSVVIPHFNAADTLAETLASACGQKDVRVEVIVVDDGSSQVQFRRALTITAQYEDVRLIRKPNGGPGSARNYGASRAWAPLIAFLDADDVLAPGALRAHLRAFADNRALGVSFGRVRITARPGSGQGRVSEFLDRPALSQIIGENRVCTASNIVVRREAFRAIGGFSEVLMRAEDQEWLGRAWLHKDWQMRGLDLVTLDYRVSDQSLSSDFDKFIADWERMIQSVLAACPDAPKNTRPLAEAKFYRYLARRALREGKKSRTISDYARKAMRAAPALALLEPKRTLATLGAAFLYDALPRNSKLQPYLKGAVQ